MKQLYHGMLLFSVGAERKLIALRVGTPCNRCGQPMSVLYYGRQEGVIVVPGVGPLAPGSQVVSRVCPACDKQKRQPPPGVTLTRYEPIQVERVVELS